MRLLHRNDDVHTDDERQHDVETTEHDEHTHRRHTFRNPFARDDTARDDTVRRDTAVARDRDRDRHTRRTAARDAAAARDGAVAERERAEGRREVQEEEIVETRKRVDLAGFLTAAYGAALAAIGALALVRTGVDDTWYEPVDQVARIDHSPLLGAIELGVGGPGAARPVVRPADVRRPGGAGRRCGRRRWWPSSRRGSTPSWRSSGAGPSHWPSSSLALGLLLIATRDRRRERRVVHRPVTA